MLHDALANCGGNVEKARDALRDMGLREKVRP
jgi:translation elongation factor EF-Ts